jgi:hypothetical protein
MVGILTSCSELVNFESLNQEMACIYLPQYQVSATVRLIYVRPIPAFFAEAAMRRIPLPSRHLFWSTSCSNADGQLRGLWCATPRGLTGQGERINHSGISKLSILLLQKEGAA